MLRHFSDFEKSIIKAIVENENGLTELLDLLEPFLNGATMTVQYEDDDTDVNIRLQANLAEDVINSDERINELYKELLEFQTKMVFAANLMEYLHHHKLIYVYSIDNFGISGKTYGIPDAISGKKVTVYVSDKEVKTLVQSYWQKRFIPNQALIDLCCNDFLTQEESSERTRNRLTSLSIGVAFMVGLGSLCFQVIDKMAQSHLNKVRSEKLVSEIHKLNQNIQSIAQKPSTNMEPIQQSLEKINQSLNLMIREGSKKSPKPQEEQAIQTDLENTEQK